MPHSSDEAVLSAERMERAAHDATPEFRLEDAVGLLREGLAIREAYQGEAHPDLIWTQSLWIEALRRKHQPESAREAAHIGERRLALRRAALAGAPDELAYSLRELMDLYTFGRRRVRHAPGGRTSTRAGRAAGGKRRAGRVNMAGELLIQVIDMGRFRAIRPALDELDAARALGLETLAVLSEAATSPLVRGDRHRGLAALLRRILNHPELELRVFLAPAAVDGVIEGLVHALCFENGAEFSLVTSVGPSWVVLDIAFAVFMDLDWRRSRGRPAGVSACRGVLLGPKSGGCRMCSRGAPAPAGRSHPHRDRGPVEHARRALPPACADTILGGAGRGGRARPPHRKGALPRGANPSA
jgi:hypothetical protein